MLCFEGGKIAIAGIRGLDWLWLKSVLFCIILKVGLAEGLDIEYDRKSWNTVYFSPEIAELKFT